MTNEAKGMSKGLLIGILTGAAVGSVVALLYAPKSGKKLREDIKTKSQDFIEDADKYISNARMKASQLFQGVKKKSGMLVSEAEEEADKILDDSEKILNDAKEKVDNYILAGKAKLEEESEHLKTAIKAGAHSHHKNVKDELHL